MLYESEEYFNSLIIKDVNIKYEVDLKEIIFQFALETLKFLMMLPYKRELDVFRNQLSKSATSIGANFEEAQSTSYKEFVQKMRIALREANESRYWLKLLKELKIGDLDKLVYLQNEGEKISRILGSIVSKAHKKLNS